MLIVLLNSSSGRLMMVIIRVSMVCIVFLGRFRGRFLMVVRLVVFSDLFLMSLKKCVDSYYRNIVVVIFIVKIRMVMISCSLFLLVLLNCRVDSVGSFMLCCSMKFISVMVLFISMICSGRCSRFF